MSFRRGVNRLLVVAIFIWELFWLFLLFSMHGDGDPGFFMGFMLGGPIVAVGVVRALFWIIEGFKGSPLQ